MELMEVDDEEEGGALVELLLLVMEEVELGRSWEEASPATWPEVGSGVAHAGEKEEEEEEKRRRKKEKEKKRKEKEREREGDGRGINEGEKGCVSPRGGEWVKSVEGKEKKGKKEKIKIIIL